MKCHPTTSRLIELTLRFACTLVLAVCALGCSNSEPRFEMKGQITLNGKPLENATLIFTPKRKGQVVAAIVVHGTFTVPQAIGPTLGEYSVRVNPLDGHGDPESFVTHSKVGKNQQVIPKTYQGDGKLSVSVTGTPGETLLLELFSGATQSHGALRQ
jgi:hypothetical protein